MQVNEDQWNDNAGRLQSRTGQASSTTYDCKSRYTEHVYGGLHGDILRDTLEEALPSTRRPPTTANQWTNTESMDKDCQLPTTAGHHTSIKSMGKDVAPKSLDQRFGGKQRQLPMTASPHLWSIVKAHVIAVSRNGVGGPSLDQRFTNTRQIFRLDLRHGVTPRSAGPSTTLRRISHWSLQVKCRQPSLRPQTALQDCNTNQAHLSHSARATDACHWTSESQLHSSIKASAGAQQRNTDKENTAITDARTRGGDAHGNARCGIGSTESRLATLGWSLDFDEMDRSAPSEVNSV